MHEPFTTDVVHLDGVAVVRPWSGSSMSERQNAHKTSPRVPLRRAIADHSFLTSATSSSVTLRERERS